MPFHNEAFTGAEALEVFRAGQRTEQRDVLMDSICNDCGHTFGEHNGLECVLPAEHGYPKDTDTLPAWMLEDKP